ncbi:MAG: MMPL family transporter, partial [Myxococcota bacterium]
MTQQPIERAARAWSQLSLNRPWLPLVIGALLTALALPYALTMRLDTDIKRMLPDDLPVVHEMDQTTAKVGGIGYFSVLVEHDDTDTAIRFIEAMAKRVEADPHVRAVIYENPVDFLRKTQLLYVPEHDLERIHSVVKRERARMNPFYVDLRTDEEKRIAAEETKRQLDWVRETRKPIDNMKRYHTSEDGRVVAMQIRPRTAVTSIGATKDMYRDLQAEAAALKAEGEFPTDLNVYVSGSLRNKVDEYRAIVSDIGQSAWISILLVMGVLLILFRRPVRIAALTAPLLMGMVWAFGLSAILIGYLNIITATLMVILFGLGIDHGIHLLERYLSERANGQPNLDALTHTLAQTGRATTVSALTTAGGFLVLIGTDFKGFSHLGIIAGISMLTIIAAYLLALPAILGLLERYGWLRIGSPTAPPHRDWKTLLAGRAAANLMRTPTWVAPVLALVLAVTGVAAATQLEFNDDFATLLAR